MRKTLMAGCAAAVLAACSASSAHTILSNGKIVDYSDWELRGMHCCGNFECFPTKWRLNPDTLEEEILVGKTWRKVNRSRLLHGSSPDGRAHACTNGGKTNPGVYIRCIKLPAVGS